MAIVESISLDEEAHKIFKMFPDGSRSKFVCKQILNYYNKNILPSIPEIKERLKHDKGFEIELMDFVNKCKEIINK